jgi:hypothetical protein
MTTMTNAGLSVPARELLHAALAACSIEYFRTKKGFVDPRWRVGDSTPLTIALLATATVAARWQIAERRRVADKLFAAFVGKPHEGFPDVARRLMYSLELFGTTLFSVHRTFGAGVRYYEMETGEHACRRIIDHEARVYGGEVTEFCHDVAHTFASMRVFIVHADEAKRSWLARRTLN